MSRLTHDINQYGVMMQPKANTTLKAMTKAELIDYIRTLEHNYNVTVDFNERQARNVESELKKYQRYKDLEEQGKLIELPCLPNEEVWESSKRFGTHKTMYASREAIVGAIEAGYAIGYTQEEAEAKLAEMEGE